ncbi:hypothetical protein [Litorilituus lipolyticus]|uniref:Uncharacterized protein n=1 Tax=Litorilituus lipolyticus TaxID=2491017 RepID=A0A502KUS7_9GAMM|nr:hypothetical protein [Litorilituus lipolyticus]TPH13453.1 hypothetical protein EPA86_14795 [Litorilituus lipolyticus]
MKTIIGLTTIVITMLSFSVLANEKDNLLENPVFAERLEQAVEYKLESLHFDIEAELQVQLEDELEDNMEVAIEDFEQQVK